MRKLSAEGSEYKVVHQELLRDLLLLSTSTYRQVKKRNQDIIWFPFSHEGCDEMDANLCVHL